MGDHDDPSLGTKSWIPDNDFAPAFGFGPRDVEAEAGEDDVPPLVGNDLKFQRGSPLPDTGGPAPFIDLPDTAPPPFASYERFNSGASSTVYRAQVLGSHDIITSTPCEPQPSEVTTARSVEYSNTFEWVFEETNRQQHTWGNIPGSLASEKQPLWTKGMPGIGKSMLMAFILRRLGKGDGMEPCCTSHWLYKAYEGFSSVSKNRFGLVNYGTTTHPHVAVKELRSDDKLAFARELQALRRLNNEPHRHIVSLLASYRHRERYHLVFPWADSDLSMFWRLNPNPQPTRELASWVVGQMTGLTDALGKVHGSLGNSNDGPGNKTDWYGRHGDIKPSNILWFREKEYGVLQLADFGLSSMSRSRDADHKQMDERPIRYTPAYRAPEFMLPQDHIGQKSDIFSLGCVFMEFLTWYLLGASAVDELASLRADDPDQAPSTGDAFFEAVRASGNEGARLKPKIKEWITRLQNHRRSSCLTNDLLRLVLAEMLVIESSLRSTARDILDRLARIDQDLNNDDSYVMSKEARCLELDYVDDNLWDPSGYPSSPDRDCPQVYSTMQSSVHVSNRKRKNSNDTETSKRPHQRKFGCPYLKAGYPQEHILRCHTPASFKNPLICGRCLESFKSQELVVQHLQASPPCLIKSPEIINGKMGLEQVMNLHSMKRKRPDMTEEDQWFEIYRVIFPSEDLPASPYHEDLTISSFNTISTESSTGISEYKDHLRRPMSEVEQLALGEKLGSRVGISNPETCKMLAAAFREEQLKDVQEFGRQKLEPVYGMPVLNNATPKAEAAGVEAQVGDAVPCVGAGHGDPEWWLNFELDDGEFGLEA
ncbi:kinase-like domain-containing protein [Immersiella caudata]|uniref:Kinase-like domain-containing protein n=1 Tax=Immersiella caudata TaxID=314043 RepID=A0AA39WSM2_9PEZI|nr:kinase-like domain-containing protein [Immersiella caudata]